MTYGHDVRLPGMLHGRILYSRYPHARILNIDASRAGRLPGVKCILTAADNPPTRFGYGKDNTPFKGEIVRSLRDEVAGVVAIDADVAEEALELIEVEYEPLPPVFTAAAALAPHAPLIHPERGSNLFTIYNYTHGDLETGQTESEVVVEASYRLPYVNAACMLIVKEGQVLNPDFLDYRLFTAADMPKIETFIIETDDPDGPFGAKGVGEMGGTPTAAAIANAIYDAVGVRLTETPMTPERVLAALDKNHERSP